MKLKQSNRHIDKAVENLAKQQSPQGYWNAQLETNCCMEAQWLMASVFCGIEYERNAQIAEYIINS